MNQVNSECNKFLSQHPLQRIDAACDAWIQLKIAMTEKIYNKSKKKKKSL